jgi:hypothetical protein
MGGKASYSTVGSPSARLANGNPYPYFVAGAMGLFHDARVAPLQSVNYPQRGPPDV